MWFRIFINILLALICVVPLVSEAQTQHGIAKTKGRLSVDGTVISGSRLQGVTVKVKGRTAVLSDAEGEFSFPVPGGKYSLDVVKKNGYQLVDPESLSRQYIYSGDNPLMIVMETPERKADDELANERRIRRSLQQQLMQKEGEIEQMREEQRVTQEEYRKMLRELYARQETSEQLIGKMVDYYSRIDYDQLDDFNRHISAHILNGELSEADSLLDTKGDIGERIAALNRHRSANAEEDAELSRRQKALARSKVLAQKELDDIAADCYHKYEIYSMKYENDSALYYLELRALLDTTNVAWQIEAGNFAAKYVVRYDKAVEYYHRSLRNAKMHYGENSPMIAACLSNIGSISLETGNYANALDYYLKALSVQKSAFGDKHPAVAISLNNIGKVYSKQGEVAKAMEYYQEALDIRKNVYGDIHPAIAMSLNSIGLLYRESGDIGKAMECFHKALDIWKVAPGDNQIALATSINNMGSAYLHEGNYDKALECFQESLKMRENVYGKAHPSVAVILNNIGRAYYSLKKYDKALEYYKMALDILEDKYGERHPYIALSLRNIGSVYKENGSYEYALECYKRSSEISKIFYESDNPVVVRGNMLTYEVYMYLCSKSDGYKEEYRDFISEYVFVKNLECDECHSFVGNDMNGEYYLLELGDWHQDSFESIINVCSELQGKSGNAVVMKDGIISQCRFDAMLCGGIRLKFVGKDEKLKISEAYSNWKGKLQK